MTNDDDVTNVIPPPPAAQQPRCRAHLGLLTKDDMGSVVPGLAHQWPDLHATTILEQLTQNAPVPHPIGLEPSVSPETGLFNPETESTSKDHPQNMHAPTPPNFRLSYGDILGEGRDAVVYRASWNGKLVAVKKYYNIDDESRKKAVSEGMALRAMQSNPNIVGFVDMLVSRVESSTGATAACPKRNVTEDDCSQLKVDMRRSAYQSLSLHAEYLLIMELLPGATLAELIEEHPERLTRETWFSFATQLASALDHVHRQHLVLHDIKPHNMMLTADGCTVKLIDFGNTLLLPYDGRSKLKSLLGHGTTTYSPPELLTPDAQYDHSVDVYSLGVTLYSAATGRMPFGAGEYGRRCLPAVQTMIAVKQGFLQCGLHPWDEPCDRFLAEHAITNWSGGTLSSSGVPALIETCLSLDTRLRPTAARLFIHLLDLMNSE